MAELAALLGGRGRRSAVCGPVSLRFHGRRGGRLGIWQRQLVAGYRAWSSPVLLAATGSGAALSLPNLAEAGAGGRRKSAGGCRSERVRLVWKKRPLIRRGINALPQLPAAAEGKPISDRSTNPANPGSRRRGHKHPWCRGSAAAEDRRRCSSGKRAGVFARRPAANRTKRCRLRTSAVCGKQSLTQRPDRPCCFHFRVLVARSLFRRRPSTSVPSP